MVVGDASKRTPRELDDPGVCGGDIEAWVCLTLDGEFESSGAIEASEDMVRGILC